MKADAGDKPLVWLHGEVRTPPLSHKARVSAGVLLRRVQRGEVLSLPQSRPLPVVGRRCHELRLVDGHTTWRVVYRTDDDAVVIAGVFAKKTRATPEHVLEACRRRLRAYDAIVRPEG
jgi:phage-related protein